MLEKSLNNMDFHTLTHPQKRIWYLEKIYPDTSMFNIGGPIRIRGTVDFSILKDAINAFLERNEGSRLRIVEKDGEAKQYVSNYREIEPAFYDFSTYENPEKEFDKWVTEQAQKPFSLFDSNLFEFSFFKISDNDNGYLPKFHHIIADGWSIQLFTEMICKFYMDLLNNRAVNTDKADSYIEFIYRENEYLKSERFNKNKMFWNEVFNIIPNEFECTSSPIITGRRKTFHLNASLSDAIRNFVKNNKVSLNTFFVFLHLLYINKTTGQTDIILGTPVLNRSGKKEKNMFGMFTSAMPCRFILDEKSMLHEAIIKVNEELTRYYFNQKYPYELLAKDLELKRKGIDNLYNVCVNYYNTRLGTELNGVALENTEFYNGNQVYSLQLVIKDWSESGEIILDFDYKIHDYKEEQIICMYEHMITLINQVVLNQTSTLRELSLLTEEIKKSIVYDFNDTKALYSKAKTINQLFEEQVLKAEGKIAVRHKDREITYKELNEKANQLAGYLIKKGVVKEDIVGLYLKHSIETIVAILAVLKSGSAYMPIEPGYPKDRVNYMLKESGAKILLINFVVEQNFDFDGEVIDLNNEESYTVGGTDISPKVGSPEDLAYVIFTSGSTGKPKAVMIENKSLVNYIQWAEKMYVKNNNEVFPLYSSLAFDLTVTSIFTPLISGNQIEVYNQENEEDFVLYRIIKERKATVVKLTPSHLSLLKDMDHCNSTVSRFIVGGENLKTSLAHNIFECFGRNIDIYNEYGPTEATVGCMIHRYDSVNDTKDSVPIGKPADNTQIYILDKYLNSVPIGVHGEMYISGDGLARGYLNSSQLTNDRFIDNPFVKGRKMYKTGDLAKFTDANKIVYIGRADNQVKLRGNRIELGEIEKHLMGYESVSEAVVIDREHEKNGNKYLCAYIVRKSNSLEIELDDLREYLMNYLPEYMIPAFFIEIKKIPITISGKINKALLPLPESNNNIYDDQIISENSNEKILIEIIREVLKTDKISIKDNFYYIGGDSINAIKISSMLNDRGYAIKAHDILDNPVIKNMAAYMGKNKKVYIEQGICEGNIKPTPITSWFFEQQFENCNHYNQSAVLRFRHEVSVKNLEIVLNELLKHHDMLRTNYNKGTKELFYNNTYLDMYHTVNEYDLSGLSTDGQNNKIRELSFMLKSSLDIENGILIKACLFNLGDNGQKVLITAHHLIVDGISWRIILEDIHTMLKQIYNSQLVQLPLKTHSYQKWAERINEYSENITLENEHYWKTIIDKRSEFIVGNENIGSTDEYNRILSVSLGYKSTLRLLSEANTAYNTETEELLIIALAKTMKDILKNSRMVIEVESHGREDIFDDLNISRTVAWFTSIYPLELTLYDDDTGKQIKELKEQIRKVPLNGLDYGILKYIRKKEFFGSSFDSKIRFNYLGNYGTDLENDFFIVEMSISEDESAKRNTFKGLLDINSYIINNELHITLTCSQNIFRDITSENILNMYKENIISLIEHCCNKKDMEFTPSDFDTTDISQEELDSLFK